MLLTFFIFMVRAGADVCPPEFADRGLWRGGDAAYSIQLKGQRTLWLFGDTFVQQDENRADRSGSHFIHNSVGVSRCGRQGRFDIDYFWGDGEHPESFFQSPHPGEYYWPLAPFRYRGRLFFTLLRVKTEGASALPFSYHGVDLGELLNEQAPLRNWRLKYSPLTPNHGIYPGSSVLVERGFVYFYAFRPLGLRSERVLLRLKNPRQPETLEYYTQEGWRRGAPNQAKTIMNETASEMSVFRYRGRLLAVYSVLEMSGAHDFLDPGRGIRVRQSLRPEGPWTEPQVLLEVPELKSPSRDNIFCYAGKAHQALTSPEGIYLTYVCNLYPREGVDPFKVLADLAGAMDLYRPQSVFVPHEHLPESGPALFRTGLRR